MLYFPHFRSRPSCALRKLYELIEERRTHTVYEI